MSLPCMELSCTRCCQWGEHADMLKPDHSLRHVEVGPTAGDCVHLVRGGGCTLYGSKAMPPVCLRFDCRDIRKLVHSKTVVEICISSLKVDDWVDHLAEGGDS